MKILVITQHYYPENFRMTDISENLVKRGHEVVVICGYPNYPEGDIYEGYSGKEGKKHKNETINGVKVLRCYEHPRKKSHLHLFFNYYTVSLSMTLKALMLKEKFDCVLIHQLAPVMVARAGIAYAKKNKIPSLLYCYDLWPDNLTAGGIKKGSLIYKLYYYVSNRIYKKVNKIAVTSKRFIPYFTEFHNIDEKKVFYLPQYCEDLFENIGTEKENENKYNYVFAGNIANLQSVETIIKAAALIKKDKSIKIHIVGDGAKYKECQELAKDIKADNVIFYGRKPIEEMPKFYKMADAMIVSLIADEAISNTMPGKVQSYMCAKKAIIASINGETQDILKEAKCGIYCSAENPSELAKLFIDFKKENKEKLGENAYNYYQKNFTKEIFFENLEKEMRKLICQNSVEKH